MIWAKHIQVEARILSASIPSKSSSPRPWVFLPDHTNVCPRAQLPSALDQDQSSKVHVLAEPSRLVRRNSIPDERR